MNTAPSPYAAAWQLIRLGALRRVRHGGAAQRRAVDIPGQAAPSSARTPAVLASPPAPRGWVIVPHPGPMGGQDGPTAAGALAAVLHGIGLGTLELTAARETAGLVAPGRRRCRRRRGAGGTWARLKARTGGCRRIG